MELPTKFSTRSHSCGSLTAAEAGTEVIIAGWVQKRRDHGGVIFLDIRDRSGIIQVVVNPDTTEAFKQAEDVRHEYVVEVRGKVAPRPEGTTNANLATGEVEVRAHGLEVLNTSLTPPFEVEDQLLVDENLRLKYRYLDLRRKPVRENFETRHKVAMAARDYLNSNGFLEVETPMLTKSTPEGARDYLVPSRLQAGHFFALPQSPQLFKQLLMVGGLERYYQLARCFRDEDLRADRQPEYTQIDLEMSFVEQEDILELVEGLMSGILSAVGNPVPTPFPRLTHQQAIDLYGADKPDTRFEMTISDAGELFKNSAFKVFAAVLETGGVIKAIKASPAKPFSRKELDELTQLVIDTGAKGLVWLVDEGESWRSPVAKFISEAEGAELRERLSSKTGDHIFIVADSREVACEALGALRLELGRQLDLVQEGFNFVWVMDFPMFKWNAAENRLESEHHPFTMPKASQLDRLEGDPLSVSADAYDLVLNGVELGSGTIRIHRRELQEKILTMIGLSKEEMQTKFGFLLEALQYGAPPHGGMAFGLDRLVMLICGRQSIRDVIAFPKTQSAACPLTGAPDTVGDRQLKDLHVKTVE